MNINKNAPSLSAVALPPELAQLHDLCQVYAAAMRELTVETAKLQQEYNALIARRAPYMLEQQEAAKRTLAKIEELVLQHPEWLGEKRQLKTPHGTIKLTATTSLVIGDEGYTLARLLARGRRDDSFDPEAYYRTTYTLDKEALEKMGDNALRRLGVVRTQGDSFKFTLTTVDIAKALADSVPQQQAAA